MKVADSLLGQGSKLEQPKWENQWRLKIDGTGGLSTLSYSPSSSPSSSFPGAAKLKKQPVGKQPRRSPVSEGDLKTSPGSP